MSTIQTLVDFFSKKPGFRTKDLILQALDATSSAFFRKIQLFFSESLKKQFFGTVFAIYRVACFITY
jgi:hypothetical protein